MQPRRLVVVRHARAGQGDTDAERPLTADGHRDAEAAGAWLSDRVPGPDRALVSAARRAEETWEAVSRGAGWDLSPDLLRELYSAEPDTALDVVREVGDAATVVLLGHNPTMGSLAQLLDDGEGDAAAATGLASQGFPPGAVAVFDYDGDWSDLSWAAARVVAYRGG